MTLHLLHRSILALTSTVVLLGGSIVATGPSSAAPVPRPVHPRTETHSLRAVAAVPTDSLAPEDVAPPAQGAARATRRAATVPAAASDPVTVGHLAVVGVTWPQGSIPATAGVEIRERTGSTWGDWQSIGADDGDGPDPGTAEAKTARGGTEPWVTTADAVQVRVVGTTAGDRAQLDVVDPGTSPADAQPTVAGAAAAAGVRPTIYTRAQWGADESIRGSAPTYGTVKAAVVHHTVNSNSYSASDVPALIRGIYTFHVKSRDWSDIGYNFLIDRFGRIWEGRAGGIDRPVVGAQALGYNSQTYGAGTIGDFTSVAPPQAVLTAQAKLAAWKLGLSHINPTGTTVLTGKGTTPTVIGHRDVNQTGCPGTYLYARLPSIRSAARAYQGTTMYYPAISSTSVPFGGSVTVSARPTTDVTWRLSVASACRPDLAWTRTGTGAFTAPIGATWPGTLPDGSPAPPGQYSVSLTVSSGSGGLDNDRLDYVVTVNSAAGAPPSLCPPRLEGSNRYATAVAVSRERSQSARTVVIASGEQRATADALVAAPLARHVGGVLLLTTFAKLPPETLAELQRRGATQVLVVGGPGVVSDGVLTQLRGIGASVSRVSGMTRFDTAAAVSARMGPSHPAAFVASGEDISLVDGLVLAGPAAALDRPILFVTPTQVPAATQQALRVAGTRSVLVAGGAGVVSDAVVAALPGATRAGGTNRYGTAAAVATWARGSMPVADVTLAGGDGATLVDMLSAGQLGRVIVTTRYAAMPPEIRSWLTSTPAVSSVVVVGGPGAVSLPMGGLAQELVTS